MRVGGNSPCLIFAQLELPVANLPPACSDQKVSNRRKCRCNVNNVEKSDEFDFHQMAKMNLTLSAAVTTKEVVQFPFLRQLLTHRK